MWSPFLWFCSCSSCLLSLFLFLHFFRFSCPPWSSTSHHLARPGPPAGRSPLHLAAYLRPSYPSRWMFLNSLVVIFPYSSIFCQFWLFFVFKFVAVLLLVVWGGSLYLLTPLSWPEVGSLLIYLRNTRDTVQLLFHSFSHISHCSVQLCQ